jgi:tetratricopeptide (TPR) repeat protein
MKCYSKTFIISLLALTPVFFLSIGNDWALAQTPAPAAGAQAGAQEKEPNCSEEEFAAYEDAKNDPDYQKRATRLMAFSSKYPKCTDILPYIDFEYKSLLGLCEKEGKWELLKSLTEQWLKAHPDDPRKYDLTVGIYKAAEKLGDFPKCAECLEEFYAMKPAGDLALTILEAYTKINNLAKIIEWSDKIFKMPEYDARFMMRFAFVDRYTKSKNMPKAIEYCKLTLKSADAVKQPNEEETKQLPVVRNACHRLIGINLYEADKFLEASKEFQQAIKYTKTSEMYYFIGICQWNQAELASDSNLKQKEIDAALISLASAELIGDDPIYKKKAKEQLEKLYKANHFDNTVGIEKIYKKAKEALGIQ